MSRKLSKELREEIENTVYPALCAYVGVCGVVLLCDGTFERCKELGKEESFGGFPDLTMPVNERVSYSGSANSSTKAFPDYKEENNVLTMDKIKEMQDKLGDLKPASSPYYVLTPDEIYLLRNPPLEWEEKEMVMGVDLGVEEGTGIVTVKNTSSIEESQVSMSMTAEARSRYEELDALDKKLREVGVSGRNAGALLKQLLMRQRKTKTTKEEKPKKEDRALLI